MLIFNFHHVEPEPAHEDRRHITISPLGLSRCIRILRMFGLEIVSIRDVLRNGPGDDRQVLLTFDDGYVNNLQHALPVLEAEQCPATVFVLPGRFGGTNDWDQGRLPRERRDRLMTAEEMRAMAESGYVTFGSHGLSHCLFASMHPEHLRHEIIDSHHVLSKTLGSAYVPVLAYPWGNFSQEVLEMMADSPYHYAFTTEKGSWTAQSGPHSVPRYSAYWRDGHPLVFFLKLLRNGVVPTWTGADKGASKPAAVPELAT